MANSNAHCVNLVGHRYGSLVVVKFLDSTKCRPSGKRSFRRWICRCDCGAEKVVVGQDLRQGRTRSCGCGRRRVADPALKETYAVYKSRAVHAGHAFELTPERFKELTQSCCSYCGRPPSNISKGYRNSFIYSGLDRVDNYEGYVEGNCIPCCEMCNKAKRNISQAEFLQWIFQAAKFCSERWKHGAR